ncbi:hypothetical protein [Nocardia sp. NPDC048505]|uniref:hypothetical protein n=1 Tax=unclassified Nocardia TaxID=2637762 RepID=UPI0033F60D58
MDDGDEREVRAPSAAVTRWTVVLTCVAVVAAAYLLAGLLHEREPELTTAPVTPVPATTEPPEPEYTYVTPTATYPVRIPGCEVVEPPQEDRTVGMAFAGTREYDNPSYPWFSGPKAGAMTQALRAALPGDVEIAFAPVDASLIFQPILGDGTQSLGGFTDARATLLRGGRVGSLSVTVRQSGEPVPPCVAGALDERRRLPDGTTVDLHDTWYELGGGRTLTRTATAYLPDGSVVHASASDGTDGGIRAIVLTGEELVALATAAGLGTTAPIPPGTSGPPESCGYADSAPVIDRAQARRWDAVLAGIPLGELTLDRPLGALLPADTGGVCQVVRVTTPDRPSRLSVSISTGRPMPDRPSNSRARSLPDGAVVETEQWQGTTIGSGAPMRMGRTVTVTRPSGVEIVVSSAEAPEEALPYELLEAIATNPGFEVTR